jgi:hypothetical protein
MQCLEISCAVRPIYGSLGAKGLKDPSNSVMQAQISHSARCSKYRKCGISHAMTTLPETRTSVESLHTAEYMTKIRGINPQRKKTLKKKWYRYHNSRAFRSVAYLTLKFVPPPPPPRNRCHTLLHGLQTYSIGIVLFPQL